MIKNRIKSIIRRSIPRSIIDNARSALHIRERLRTQKIFEMAPDTPSYLGIHILETLQQKYPYPPEYGYDAKSLENRGTSRAKEILRFSGAKKAASFLELGCWDGMVSCSLRRKGKNTTAIDNRSEGFDERAFHEGVKLLRMDAAEMQFEDESFDFVFSYDGFEHFAKPERVLQEATRVVRKGGGLYINVGALYMSPFGEHAYRSISVPYCQFLFPKNFLNDFANQKGLEPIDFNHVNGWALEDYRKLWNKYSYMLKRVKYHEYYNVSHLDLIRKYPSCFKSKSKCFENFIVSNIEVLFEKIS